MQQRMAATPHHDLLGPLRRLGLCVLFTVMLTVALPPGTASAYPGAPGFVPGIEYDENFPDPHVVLVDGVYVAYGTNTGGPKIPTLVSLDLETWITRAAWEPSVGDRSPFGNDTLVQAPVWAAHTPSGPEVWAPAVVETPAGWRAYYSIRTTNGSRLLYCISVARGPGPLGPFRDTSKVPLTCGYGPAGAIDPWVHVDDAGIAWLLWKVEPYTTTEVADDDPHFPLDEQTQARRRPGGPDAGAPLRRLPGLGASIWGQQLDDDATWFAPDSSARVLLIADKTGATAGGGSSWERGIIENPSLFEIDGQHHLLYSANRWGSPDYATGWARCATPIGPCARASSAPIHTSTATELGPGGASVFIDGRGERRVAYHAWNAPYSSYPSYPACDTDQDRVCKDEGQRFLHTDVLCTLPDRRLRVGVPRGWRFCDTDARTWRGPGVAWLSDRGITTGVSPHFFAPDRPISRAEVVTLLWRWAGSPAAPASSGSPFTDLRDRAYYQPAVHWAASARIVRGKTPTSFEPDTPITRAEMATILHRAAGSPVLGAGPVATAFTDVAADAFYTTPVRWLAANTITTGLTPSTFGPQEPSTRAQFATMLCRTSRIDLGAAAPATPAVESCPP